MPVAIALELFRVKSNFKGERRRRAIGLFLGWENWGALPSEYSRQVRSHGLEKDFNNIDRGYHTSAYEK